MFRFFRFYTETESFDFSIKLKQTEHPNRLKESIFGYFFQKKLGLFRFVTKQICLFRLFRYRFKTPKQTEFFSFWFHETNRNKRETDLVLVCFGSNRNLFLFVSRTPYWLLLATRGFNYKMVAAGVLLVNAGKRLVCHRLLNDSSHFQYGIGIPASRSSGIAGHGLVRHCPAMHFGFQSKLANRLRLVDLGIELVAWI